MKTLTTGEWTYEFECSMEPLPSPNRGVGTGRTNAIRRGDLETERSRTSQFSIYLLTFIATLVLASDVRAQVSENIITQIQANVITSNKREAGTDANIYLGIGGREFLLDTPRNNFELDQEDTFVFGDSSNVVRPQDNDPRAEPQLTVGEVGRFPVYIRLSDVGEHRNPFDFPADEWIVEHVRVVVFESPLTVSSVFTSPRLGGPNDEQTVRLGPRSGFFLALEAPPQMPPELPAPSPGPDLSIDNVSCGSGNLEFRITNVGNTEVNGGGQVFFTRRAERVRCEFRRVNSIEVETREFLGEATEANCRSALRDVELDEMFGVRAFSEGRPLVGFPEIPAFSLLQVGSSINVPIPVPQECLAQDVPIELRGCDVSIRVDILGDDVDVNPADNMSSGTCG